MIKAVNLTKDYGNFRAVDQVGFKVEKGDVLGFLGPNGAGKSTTMKMITGFLPPTAGTAEIGGNDIREKPIEAKRLLGYLPESGPLYQEMTVLEFLRFISEIRGLKGKAQTDALTRALGICRLEQVRHQIIETLSKGFRQRVGMAQAILHDPPCLIMDEPTDGLDPNQKQEVRKLIADMKSEKAIILSTHILEEVQAMCNRVIIIAHGKLIADETPDKLLRRHPHFNAIHLSISETPAATVRESVGNLSKVAKIEKNGDGFSIFPREGADLKEELWNLAHEQNWKIKSLENMPVRLEEVFANLTQNPNSNSAKNEPAPNQIRKDPETAVAGR